MGTKIWLLFSYGLAVWLLSACCRSETYYVDQEVKDFTVFPVGSWWVYVDSVSGRRDSVVLTEQISGFSNHAIQSEKCEDQLEYISYAINLYEWVNEREYVQVNIRNDSVRNDLHDLLMFFRGLIRVTWIKKLYITTPIGVFNPASKVFEHYSYRDTTINNLKLLLICTSRFSPSLGYEGTIVAKRIGLIQHINVNNRIHLVATNTIQ